MSRTAVVLFNLGAPDRLSSVQPFLRNLFRDPAILRLPKILRNPLAWIFSFYRSWEARKIYSSLGGGSPLLQNTQAQAHALEKALGEGFRVFIGMQYWHPFIHETLFEVSSYRPERIVLLPLYPQFSTTTTASSFSCWREVAFKIGLSVPSSSIGCYAEAEGFIMALSEGILSSLEEFKNTSLPHLLFSAHGLPKRIIEGGDPYQTQVEQTVQAVMKTLKDAPLSYSLGYQSRVGPLEWIGPSVEEEIKRLAQEKKNILLIPVAFVSEHSETLYEMDVVYKNLALKKGVEKFLRVETVGVHKAFIDYLAQLCHEAVSKEASLICPRSSSPSCDCKGFINA